ncbi:chemotaxis protein CheB [Ectothiorhodospira mobilis]|uniref:chemotaxis protein CheB n=1 Tax=Ectothiorhodospira mobilis TaxID=195064 RepID=UPI001EE87F00|nr:chemotaxis protein CheB [Ectothiorhodospira mobilis]MCG5535852.1 ATP-binding protein [Ectothiorhodospira mobilis]
MHPTAPQPVLTLVGIGASAGGIEALGRLVSALPAHTGMAYVVAQHLSPDYQSMLRDILGREAALPVEEIRDGLRPGPDTLYTTPAGHNVLLEEGCFRLRRTSTRGIPKPSIDLLFRSLALELGDHAIGVILSGTGSDGADGLRAIQQAGGRVFVQDEATAKYPGMPQAALATGVVDRAMPPEQIAKAIAGVARGEPGPLPRKAEDLGDPGTVARILRQVREYTGVDLNHYKEGTLLRRLQRRLDHTGCAALEAYLSYLGEHPGEAEALVRELHIVVTRFFRDEKPFAEWRTALEQRIQERADREPLRLWVPGCATGEEAYSVGILVQEILRAQERDLRLQIYATDVDADALATARRGLYSAGALEVMPPELLQRYFSRRRDQFQVSQALRDVIVFARHDLLRDPPFLHLDAISCRNLLIYLKAPVQERVLERFHYALQVDGLLFLGRSETPGGLQHLFETRSKAGRIYRRLPGDARYSGAGMGSPRSGRTRRRQQAGGDSRELQQVLDVLMEAYAPPGLVLSEQLEIRRVLGRAGDHLSHGAGQTSLDAMELLPRELAMELRALVARVQRSGEMARGRALASPAVEAAEAVRLAVRRLPQAAEEGDLYLVLFEPAAGRPQPLESAAEGAQGNGDLVHALEHELAATREHLQTVVEELETSNEELQSSNEELQATNEELFTVNQELQNKSEELASLNATLANVKDSLPYALLVVDRNQSLTLINPGATTAFGVTEADVGKSLAGVDSLRRVPGLMDLVNRVVASGEPVQEQISEPGPHLLRIQPFTDAAGREQGALLSFWDNAEILKAHRALRESESRLRQILDKSPLWSYVKDRAGRYRLVSQRFLGGIGQTQEAVIGHVDEELFAPQIARLLRLADHEAMAVDGILEREHHLELEGREVVLLAQHFALRDERGVANAACMKALDITARKQDERRLSRARDEAEKANRAKTDFLSHMSHELRTPLNAILGFAQILEVECRDGEGEAVREILAAGWHLLALINDILDLSMLESGRLQVDSQSVELAQIIDECAATLRQMAQDKGVDLKVEPQEGVYVRADATRLRQVLINLLSNAIKYNRPEGWVRVRTRVGPKRVAIRVEDNGIGMTPEEMASLFQPFERTGRAQDQVEGVGIGLSLSRRLVDMMHGTLEVESEPDRGSVFTVDLPREHPGARPTRTGVDAPASSQGIQQPALDLDVIYVEDHAANLKLVRRLMETVSGVRLREAESGEQGLEAARRQPPDLILLDLNLPDMHGFEVLRRLRADRRTAGIPVVAVSADAGELRITEALERGFCAYIEKPFRLSDLEEVLSAFGHPV